MAQAFPNAFNVDSARSASASNPYAAEAFIEPWLCKHSTFYRNHFTRNGRKESKASRRQSVIEENIAASRKASAATVDSQRYSEDSSPEMRGAAEAAAAGNAVREE